MNIIWSGILIVSISILCFTNPGSFFNLLSAGSNKAITLSLSMCGIYAIWLGLLKIMEDCDVIFYLSKLLKPVTKFLFGEVSTEAQKFLVSNIASNMLGVGGIGLATGIEANKLLVKNYETITYASAMLVVLNASSVQIFPSTVISLRAGLGSHSPSDIFLPSLIVTCVTTVFSVFSVKFLWKLFKPRKVIKGDNK